MTSSKQPQTLSPEGLADLTTFRSNIRHAIRNSQSASIGGGTFNASELAVLLYAVERTIAAESK